MIFFSKNLKYIRERRGLTQAGIAIDAGFKKAQWSSWETGNSFPKLLDFVKISLFLEISETDLIHTDLEQNYVNKHSRKFEADKTQELLDTLQQLNKLQKEKIEALEHEIQFIKAYIKKQNPLMIAEIEQNYKKL